MKKRSYIIAAIMIFSVSYSFQGINGQEKSKEEKDKELQELIIEQKKAMIDQQKVQEEIQKAMENKKVEIEEAMEKAKAKMDDPEFKRAIKAYQGRAPNMRLNESFGFDPSGFNFNHHFNSDAESTTWDFSKAVKESSFSRDYIFDVESTAKSVLMSVSGDCKKGEIRIRIIMPNGKTFSEIIIDEFGNLNWRKSLTISDTENKDKTGAWKFEIKSSKASGYFKIFLQTS